jgi:hypothetical protein
MRSKRAVTPSSHFFFFPVARARSGELALGAPGENAPRLRQVRAPGKRPAHEDGTITLGSTDIISFLPCCEVPARSERQFGQLEFFFYKT